MNKGERKKIFIVMPTYTASLTIKKNYKDIPKNLKAKVSVIDDVSQNF